MSVFVGHHFSSRLFLCARIHAADEDALADHDSPMIAVLVLVRGDMNARVMSALYCNFSRQIRNLQQSNSEPCTCNGGTSLPSLACC
jgi:hypothetical protein